MAIFTLICVNFIIIKKEKRNIKIFWLKKVIGLSNYGCIKYKNIKITSYKNKILVII